MTRPPSTRTATTLSSSPLSRMMSGGAVDLRRLERQLGADRGYGGYQASHPFGPHDRPQHGLLDAATVAQGDHVRARRSSRPCKSPVSTARWKASSAPGPRPERRPRAGARSDVRPRPVGDPADRRPALVDGRRDLVVPQIEHLAQHEHRPLSRRERLQHQQHRHRDALGQLRRPRPRPARSAAASGSQGPTYDSLRRPSVRSRRAPAGR